MTRRERADKIELGLRLLRDACPSPVYQEMWDMQLETIAMFAVYHEYYGDETMKCAKRSLERRDERNSKKN